MIVGEDTVVSQAMWDSMAPDVQEAMQKCTGQLIILSNEEWEELGQMFLAEAYKIRSKKIDLAERIKFVLDNADLFAQFRKSGKDLEKFISENIALIDEAIMKPMAMKMKPTAQNETTRQ